MKISEMVDFLSQDRTHMQQGFFPDVQQMYLLHSSINFDEVSLRALVGAPLKANEFLKLEQTCLADVIVEESGNEYLRMHETHISPTEHQPTDELSQVPLEIISSGVPPPSAMNQVC